MRFCRTEMEISIFLRTSQLFGQRELGSAESSLVKDALGRGGGVPQRPCMCWNNPVLGILTMGPLRTQDVNSAWNWGQKSTEVRADCKPRLARANLHSFLFFNPPVLGARLKALHMRGKLVTGAYTPSPRLPSLSGRLLLKPFLVLQHMCPWKTCLPLWKAITPSSWLSLSWDTQCSPHWGNFVWLFIVSSSCCVHLK